jgi:diguanylate cyclase (GGDEF)-like protein
MFKWLLSRPLQIKFFLSTALLIGTGLLVLMLSVLQALNQFLVHHIEQDMQQRTHILALALMSGPAAHDTNSLKALLRDVVTMHDYCYLSIQDARGKLLASAGDVASPHPAPSVAALAEDRNSCFGGAIPLLYEGKPFGMLHYGVDTSFLSALGRDLRIRLVIIAALLLALGSALHYLLVRRLVKPLREITRASESMAQGNLDATMPVNLPQDELGKLATSFSNMAASLRDRVASQQPYTRGLYADQARLNALVSILPIGIMFVDPARQVQYINPECRRLWGLSAGEDYIGQLDTDLIARARSLVEQPDAFVQQMNAALREYGISTPFDTRLRNERIIRSRSCVVPDTAGERYIGRIWMFEDVREEYVRLHEARSRAERDSLTGLYNRRRFEEDMERMFAQAQRDSLRLTLLYFDLDDFKDINDNHGHPSGDKVLKAIAQALTLQSRRNENLYRLGGDEFAILVADAERHQVEALARRVIATVEQMQFRFDEHEVRVRCSMGIAACAPDARPDTAVKLMQQADIAMYQAKHLGKHCWSVFDPAQPLDLGKDSR